MASTSPYSPNDYQAASNYRPYELPINDIFKSISAQNQFWEAGAARIKSVYSDALNLNLTLDANKEVKKKYMEDVDKQITKLSTMDVSLPSVQRQGFNLFKPLFKHRPVMLDNQLTELQSSIYSEAERYKKDEKTKGEGYHIDNLAAALMPFKGFDKNTSSEDLEAIYSKAKNSEYIPYHNVQKELKEISVACPVNDYTGNSIQSLYFLQEKHQSQTEERLRACIKTSLSGKAWTQLLISGKVHYGDNTKSIADGYIPMLKGNNLQYAKDIIEKELELKKYKSDPKFTPEMEKSYTDYITSRKLQITNNNTEINAISLEDFSSIDKDRDNIISQVYGEAIIGSHAKAYSFDKISKLYSSNPSGIAQYTQQSINERDDRANAWKQKEYELDVLKSLGVFGGKDEKGKTSLPYQTLAPILGPIYQKYGMPDGFIPYLDEGTKSDTRNIVTEITNSVNKYKNDLVNSQDKLAFTIASINKQSPEVIAEILKNEKGDLGNYAEKLITDYYKNLKKGTKPSEDIIKLEEVLGSHMITVANSTHFTNLQKKVDEEMAKHPEIKEKTDDIYKKFNSNSYLLAPVDGWDPTIKKVVDFSREKVSDIMKGLDPDYFMKKGVIYNKWGNKLEGKRHWNIFTPSINDIERVGMRASMQEQLKEVNEDFSTKILPKMRDMIVNQMKWKVGDVPGLGASIAQEFSDIPEVATGQWRFTPTTTEKFGDDFITHFTVEEYNPDKKVWSDATKDLRKRVKNSDYSVNSMFNNVILIEGNELAVKTNYVPMAGADFELKSAVESLVFNTKSLSLKNGERRDIPITPLVGGYTLGFTVEGRGNNERSQANPSILIPYVLDSQGKKFEGPPSISSSELSGQLQKLKERFYQVNPYRK